MSARMCLFPLKLYVLEALSLTNGPVKVAHPGKHSKAHVDIIAVQTHCWLDTILSSMSQESEIDRRCGDADDGTPQMQREVRFSGCGMGRAVSDHPRER